MTHSRTAHRVASLRPTAVNAILAEVQEHRRLGGQPISLMRGEPDLPTPQHIVKAAQTALANGRTAYPHNQGEPALREAVSGKMNRQGIGSYSADDEVLITTGATFGVYAALAAVLNPGDEVLLPEPIYDAYLGVISMAGGVARSVPAEIADGRFTLNPDAFASACSPQTRVLLLNTPWNPTGAVLTEEELSALMAIADEKDLVVISDEIYEAIVYDGGRHVSPASLSDNARNRTIVVNSFSKTYAMTGWRLGYCCGPGDLIRAMSLALQQSSRGPATFVQDAGVAALKGPQDCVDEMRYEYAARRQQVIAALSNLPNAQVLTPQAGFFAMVDVRKLGLGSNEVRQRLLKESDVVVMHGAAYGPSAEGTLRVSFATGGENLEQGLKRLRAGLAAIASEGS